jgi:hypothetical protein
MDEGLIGGEGFAVDASVVKADASRQKHRDDDDDWDGGSRAINEYLDALKEDGSSIPADKKISLTDPAAQWTCAPGGPAYYAYSTNYLVDTDNGIIVDVEATPALRTPEVWSTKIMIERVKDRFGLETKKLIGDTAYGTAKFLNWMVNEANIEPHVPVWDRAKAKMPRSVALTLHTTQKRTAIPARTASSCSSHGVTTRYRGLSRRTALSTIVLPSWTAVHAR